MAFQVGIAPRAGPVLQAPDARRLLSSSPARYLFFPSLCQLLSWLQLAGLLGHLIRVRRVARGCHQLRS